MTIEILSEASVPTPSSGTKYLFLNADKNNQLYWKNSDGTFEPYTGDDSTAGSEIAAAWSAALNCALTRGMITSSQFQDLMNTGLTYTTNTTTDSDGNVTTTVSVGSRNVALISITLNSATGSVDISSPTTYQITTTFNPTNTSNQGLIYVSSDVTMATVSSTGLVSPVGAGTPIITVIPQSDPSKAKIVTITVTL